MASRTDRGVSAVGNALFLSTDRTGPVVLRALNGIAPDVFFTAAARAPEGFRVRQATRRVYLYFEPSAGRSLDRWRAAADLFTGTVDVRSFGRGIPAASPVLRTVESVRVDQDAELLVVEVRAPSFVWGMVRKIVAALREVDGGRLSMSRLSAALAGRLRLTLPMAEPEGLLLWDVEYPLEWEYRWSGPNRHQARWWESARASLLARGAMLGVMSRSLPVDPDQV